MNSFFVKQSKRRLTYLLAGLAAVTIAYGIRRSAMISSAQTIDQSSEIGQVDSSLSYPEQVFATYEKSLKLGDNDPATYQNLATAVFAFRNDARKYFGLKDEQAVINRSMDLYRHALELNPGNFPLAMEIAENYHAITPLRGDEAIAALNVALKSAGTPEQRESVYLDMARFHNLMGRVDLVRADLEQVHASANLQFKQTIIRHLAAQKNAATHHASIQSVGSGGQ